jgi:superfamily II DNA/RNA helicase
MTFDSFALSPALLRGVADHGYTTPTPIQQDAIPLALAGRDLIASAQTGTGKTAAFMLPALERLQIQKPVKRSAPRVLVLTPTRELALQIITEGKIYGRHARVAQGAIIGGVGYGPQLQLLGQRIDLLVATPGRMIDHLERQSVRLDQVELLVLDEADRMLDMGFIHAVKRIVGHCPKARQTLMFTATWDDRLAKLAKEMLVDPVRVEVAAPVRETPAITQTVHLADDNDHKHNLLRHVLAGAGGQSLVFAGTKRKVKRLAEKLEREGVRAGMLHGDMAQNARNRSLDLLRANKIDVMVATDVAGRGIDVTNLALVVNVDLPNVPEDYVHRIGRTGRAGATGRAVSIVSIDDRPLLAQIEKLTKTSIERVVVPGLEPTVVDHPAMRHAAPGRQRQPQQKRPQQGRPQQGRSHGGGQQNRSNGGGRHGGQQGPAQAPRQPTQGRQAERTPAPAPLDEHRPAFLMRKTAAR